MWLFRWWISPAKAQTLQGFGKIDILVGNAGIGDRALAEEVTFEQWDRVGDSNRLPAGQGHLDFPSVLATLRETGYRRYLSAELLPLPDSGCGGAGDD